ncbi:MULTISPECIES: hypothetical protein [Rhizobium]|uniref:hypothetical protein n=1 Tax=Rhizobium TaxID=379 RepID=UPI0019331A0D|nr:hypothetical protein [Rhizobium rosettiformans]
MTAIALDLDRFENIIGTNSVLSPLKAGAVMQYHPRERLQLNVAIALGCFRRTTIRGFAGYGPSRRRDWHLTPTMVDAIVRTVTASLSFYKDDRTVILSRVAHHVEKVLNDVADNEARALAGIDARERDRARQAIAGRITERLCQRYTIRLTPRPVMVPATGVWCGLDRDQGDEQDGGGKK